MTALLGLAACERSDRVPEGKSQHTVVLSGIFRGGFEVGIGFLENSEMENHSETYNQGCWQVSSLAHTCTGVCRSRSSFSHLPIALLVICEMIECVSFILPKNKNNSFTKPALSITEITLLLHTPSLHRIQTSKSFKSMLYQFISLFCRFCPKSTSQSILLIALSTCTC